MYRLYADLLSIRYQEHQKHFDKQKQMQVRPTTVFSPYGGAISNLGSYLVHVGHKLKGVSLKKENYSSIGRHSA